MQSFSDWIQFIVSSAVVVLFLLILLGIIILILKRTKKHEKSHISVEHLNKTWRKQKEDIQKEILTEKELADVIKQDKKTKKEESTDASTEIRQRVFVIDFDGDLMASACASLRDLVSTIISIARTNDEVVVRLESPGGVVHGYGLAASQLARLTERKIHLTVCVDKVAASGGYMMACVANKIVAAPFSMIGSIGVLSSTPNFNRLLKKHDVDFIEQTAGEYKRTVTLFGEVSESKKARHQQELDVIHGLFKEHVARHRPQLNINEVSTGEVWLGRLALDHGLVDALQTSDDLLLALGEKSDVYLLKTEQEVNWKARLMKQFFSSAKKFWTI